MEATGRVKRRSCRAAGRGAGASNFLRHRLAGGAGGGEVGLPVGVAPGEVGVGLEAVHRVAGVVLHLDGAVRLDEGGGRVADAARDGAFEDGEAMAAEAPA